MDVPKVTGGNLKRIRTEMGMTQEDLARKLGAQKQNVSSMEHGRRGLSSATIARLCEIFACSPSDFFKLESNHHEGIDRLLQDEIAKMDKPTKAALYARAVALNSMAVGAAPHRRVGDRIAA